MKPIYVLDACAMLAVIFDEVGSDAVAGIYEKSENKEVVLIINKLNLLEVYYDLVRSQGKESADKFYEQVKKSPIIVKHEITDEVFEEAGRLKATYKISLADSIALAETSVHDGELLTSDHHEFDAIEKRERIKFCWIR
jgi:predicted nucleic acid-binding protein